MKNANEKIKYYFQKLYKDSRDSVCYTGFVVVEVD